MISLQFFGTSAGMPSKWRNVSCLGIRIGHQRTWALVDCGDGAQRQLMHAGVSLAKISHIFITHLHGDHILGLPGLLGSRALLGCRDPLVLVGPRELADYAAYILKVTHTRLPYALRCEVVERDWQGMELGGFRITALPLVHSVPSWAYQWEELHPPAPLLHGELQRLGIEIGPLVKKIKQGGSITLGNGQQIASSTLLGPRAKPLKLIIAGDNGDPGVLLPHLDGVDLLVHEATYTAADGLAMQGKVLHTATDALARAAEAGGVGSLIATHLSTRYHGRAEMIERYRQEIALIYRGRFFVANDFSAFTFDRKNGLRLSERSS